MSARATRRAVATALVLITLMGVARDGVAQMPSPASATDRGAKEMEVPHGFFTHEGLPDPVGTFSLRTAALATRVDGRRRGFRLSSRNGTDETIGLHIRNARFLNSPMTEVMFQFAAVSPTNCRFGEQDSRCRSSHGPSLNSKVLT